MLDALKQALYMPSLAAAGSVESKTTQFAVAGIGPYFRLFSGLGQGATCVNSNHTQAKPTGGDIDELGALAAGDCRPALGAFENFSFAENRGSGTLADSRRYTVARGTSASSHCRLSGRSSAPSIQSILTSGLTLPTFF